MTGSPVLLQVDRLHVHFRLQEGWGIGRRGVLRAVDGVSFTISEGETLGLVGESGCGKSTLGRAVLRLVDVSAGKVRFAGTDITKLSERRLRPLRRHMQIIFQDPFGSLNPRRNVRDIVGEAMLVHKLVRSADAMEERVRELLERVGLPKDALWRYPHEFSGGQRQRIAIARALALSPRLVVADEPLAALDVSIQTQIVNLLRALQREMGLAFLFIGHDLRMIEYLSDRVAVMYLGKFVETAPKRLLFDKPLHPYTKALLAAVPVPDPEQARKRIVLGGDVPNPIDPPSGCPFHPRCPEALPACRKEVPELREIEPGRFAACLRVAPAGPAAAVETAPHDS
ncbi:MAG: ATP-binding cassette domain-containing protein [Deltaproteobacteria bacterium]|nr:ATP-binding cassette domain-containing protein [Deltaproteobacteria bacterium]